MENNNWKPGDIAICVNTGRLDTNSDKGVLPSLRLKAEYIVNKVHLCECGSVSLDVGLGLGISSKGVECNCGALSSPKTGIWWCNAIRFVKKKTREAIKEEMDEAIADENYELAQQLDDQLRNHGS